LGLECRLSEKVTKSRRFESYCFVGQPFR